jgi:transcriptional regulator of aromatic amino acid metabolism
MVARSNWPVESEGVMFYAPAVLFEPDSVVFMGTADIKGVQFVVTIELAPGVNEDGLLKLGVTRVKVGAMNITPLAKMMAKKMYAERLAEAPVDIEDLRTRIAAALLNEEPFEPVFDVEDKKVRLKKITVEEEKLIMHLIPEKESNSKNKNAKRQGKIQK